MYRVNLFLLSLLGLGTIATALSGDLKLWADDGAPIATFSGHVGSTEAAEFSPDGKQLASTGVDGDVRLWRVDRPRTEIALANAGTASWRGTFSADAKQIAITGADNVARIYDGESGALVHELRGHTANITWIAFAPDGGGPPWWDGFASASLIVPEVSLARKAGEVWLTM